MKKIEVFDFDGTIFKNPTDTPENKKKYEDNTGLPWIIDKQKSRELTLLYKKYIPVRKGWYGRSETLEPPLVPFPIPKDMFIQDTCNRFLESKKNPDVHTILMTGRHCGLKSQVLNIMKEGKLIEVKKDVKDGNVYCKNIDPNVVCYFLGDNGPRPKGDKPTSTLLWKIWILEQYSRVFPELETIEIWEDREEHVSEFSKLNGKIAKNVIVNFVKVDY